MTNRELVDKMALRAVDLVQACVDADELPHVVIHIPRLYYPAVTVTVQQDDDD